MDNKALETLSVSAVRNSIVVCDLLDQFINDNDKEPSWDGFVYIYNKRGKRKEDLRGRVAVQVKGRANGDFSRLEISESAEVSDLKNYLYGGGVVYFVVFIGSSNVFHKIYYSTLTPMKIRRILSDTKSKKSRTIRLKEFPTSIQEKETIFADCLDHCRRQASFANSEPVSLEALERQGSLESVTTYMTGRDLNPYKALLTNELNFYAKIKGVPVEVPLDSDIHITQTIETQSASITSGGIEYYSELKRIRSIGTTKILLGESFELVFVEGVSGCKINYKPSNFLRVLVKDLSFMIAFIINSGFEFDGLLFDYKAIASDISAFKFEEQKENLAFYKKAVQALNILNCAGDLKLDTLSIVDRTNMAKLITAFIDHKPVSGLKNNLPPVVHIVVGPYTFALHLQPYQGQEGTYTLLDFFRTELSIYTKDDQGEKYPVSQFIILQEDEYIILENMRVEALLPSYQRIAPSNRLFESANMALLNMLKAYDKSKCTRSEYLNAAREFAEWLMNASDEYLPYEVRKLNQLQIILRERALTTAEQKEIYAIIEGSRTREDVLVGAYLLLGAQPAAEMHFALMEPSMQVEFVKYPIYSFWNESK